MAIKTRSASNGQVSGDTAKFGSIILPRFEEPQHEDFVPEFEHYVDANGYGEELAWAWSENEDVLLLGPTGTGKTALVRHACHLTNSAYRRVACQEATDTAALIGKPWLWVDPDSDRQEMIFQRGTVYDSVLHGHKLLLDEANLMHPDVALALNPLYSVDEGVLIVMENEGEVVPRHEDFRMVATGNPHTYAGVKEWNAATLSRYGVVIWMDYLEPDVERKIVLDYVPGFDAALAESMVSAAKVVREAYSDETIRFAPSIRELKAWAKASIPFGVARAAELTVVNKCEEDDKDPVRELLSKTFSGGQWNS